MLTRYCDLDSHINTLVMDYLVSEGYPSAAQNFALEANVHPRVDIESIEERVVIRNAIYGGDIQTAIERINELNPQVRTILDLSPHHSISSAMIRFVSCTTHIPSGVLMRKINYFSPQYEHK